MNYIKLGVFWVQDTLYNSSNIISKKFIRNNVCVLGFKSKREVVFNGVKYHNVQGICIDMNKKKLEVNYSVSNSVNVPLDTTELFTIEKQGSAIVVNRK